MRRKTLAIALAVPAAVLGWALFRPELLFVNQSIDEKLTTTNIVKMGTFVSYAHETKGNAQIVDQGGTYYLQLSDFHTSNGPDVRVYLVKDKDADKGTQAGQFIDLGPIKGNVGNQRYRLPEGAKLDHVKSIAIWCARFNVGFGGATLNQS
jgi:hypothetical protein